MIKLKILVSTVKDQLATMNYQEKSFFDEFSTTRAKELNNDAPASDDPTMGTLRQESSHLQKHKRLTQSGSVR